MAQVDALRDAVMPDIPHGNELNAANLGAYIPTSGIVAGTVIAGTGALNREWPLAGYGTAIAAGSYGAGRAYNAAYKALHSKDKKVSKVAAEKSFRSNAAKDRYWKKQEELAESSRNAGLLMGGAPCMGFLCSKIKQCWIAIEKT